MWQPLLLHGFVQIGENLKSVWGRCLHDYLLPPGQFEMVTERHDVGGREPTFFHVREGRRNRSPEDGISLLYPRLSDPAVVNAGLFQSVHIGVA